jgi:CheY-like chemotaxis protein
MGYRVQYYISAAQFLFSLRLRLPDCVIIDAEMPQTSGLELLACLRPSGWKIPSILMSDQHNDALWQAAEPFGVRSMLVKPYTTADLSSTISHALGCPGIVPTRCPWPCPAIGKGVWNCAFSGFPLEAREALNSCRVVKPSSFNTALSP